MARPLRIQYEGALYHVMNRGARREPIFIDEAGDRALFLSAVSDAVHRWRVQVHAFSLMGNHYHLLIETPLANLSRAMRHIDGVYTQRFNRRHGRDGPLFRGRFKSILVEKETYFVELVRYIHLNGVRAGLFKDPGDDHNASHALYLNGGAPPWLEKRLTLSFFASHPNPLAAFDAFVKAGAPPALEKTLAKPRWPAVLGGKNFIKTIRRNRLQRPPERRDVPQMDEFRPRAAGANDVLLSIIDFWERNAGGEKAGLSREFRWILMHSLRRYAQLTHGDIAMLLDHRSADAVEKILDRSDFGGSPFGRLIQRQLEMSDVGT